jgi:hypothetical protein
MAPRPGGSGACSRTTTRRDLHEHLLDHVRMFGHAPEVGSAVGRDIKFLARNLLRLGSGQD